MSLFRFIDRRYLLQRIASVAAAIAAGGRGARAAPTAVSLQCVTTDGGENRERHFGINFNVAASRWTESEPGNSSDVFKTKSGNYVTVANVTSLRRDDSARTVVGILQDFNPSTARQGDTRRDGKALETGRTFRWTVDLVVP